MDRIHEPRRLKRLDHLGIIAGTIDDLGIVEKIDSFVPPVPQRIVSVGNAVKAMILNALGFVSRPLYLHSQFFDGKPVEHLFRDDKTTTALPPGADAASVPLLPDSPVGEKKRVLTAENFDDNTLGRALDDLHEAGLTSVFFHTASMAIGKAAHMNRAFRRAQSKPVREALRLYRLDSTSFSVSGEYAESEKGLKRDRERAEARKMAEAAGNTDLIAALDEEEAEPFVIRITHGYSKDHRSDLKQFMANIVTVGDSRVPIWFEALSGNASDKRTFRESIESFLDNIKKTDETCCFVMDSASYTSENITALSPRIHWITRAPETVGFVKRLLAEVGPVLHAFTDPPKDPGTPSWVQTDPSLPGYRWAEVGTVYAGVPQRILVVYSEQNFNLEKKTLKARVEKEHASLTAALNSLASESFSCEDDAKKALEALFEKSRYHRPGEAVTSKIMGHLSKGRPKKEAEPVVRGFQISALLHRNQEAVESALLQKGLFVIASNNLDETTLSSLTMVHTYKMQGQTVEGSIRFFKDPRVYAEAFFLKKEARIMALITVMALALLVYAIAEQRLREALQALKESLPNQRKRPTSRPTLRWVFQLMENIHWEPCRGDPEGMIGITDLQLKVVSFFPPGVRRYYGLGADSCQIE